MTPAEDASGSTPPAQHGGTVQRTNTRRSVTVMYLGFLAIMSFWLFGIGLIPAVLALVLAPGARREIAESPRTRTGSTLISIGRTLAVVAIGIPAAALVAYAALQLL